jgi:hypothetical protein
VAILTDARTWCQCVRLPAEKWMDKEDLYFDLEPFDMEIKILVAMPDGELRHTECCYYSNINGEGFAIIKASAPGGSEHG